MSEIKQLDGLYVCISPSGVPQFNTIELSMDMSIISWNDNHNGAWHYAKQMGWTCHQVTITFTKINKTV